MFSWGEDCRRGFWIKDPGSAGVDGAAEDGVHFLNLNYHIRDLSAGHNVLAFLKTNGNAFIICTNESRDGRRVRGKQKFVKCKEKIDTVSCGDESVTLLSDRGTVFSVDTTRAPFTPRWPGVHLGSGLQGQLGLGKTNTSDNSPQHLRCLSGTPLVQIAAGGEQSFALSVSGGVFSWGRNDCGQLGLGDTRDRKTPTPVNCLNKKKTVHISCGKYHTAILTKDGAVFTFGSGQYGQLGHNSFRNELRPRLVAELLGAKVTKTACGRNHTLVMTDSKKIYSFGCREQGQLGRGDESHPSVPLPVQLPQDGSDGPKIRNIFAGGNCSFATCTSDEKVHEEVNTDSFRNKTPHCLDEMIDTWTSTCDSKQWKKIKQEIQRTFSSASCVNKSFLEQSKDKHFQTSTKYPGLNLSLARRTFKKLVKKGEVFAEVEAAMLDFLPSSNKRPVGVEGLRIFLLLNELLYAIQKHKRQKSTKFAETVAAAVLSLSPESLQIIGDWLSSLSTSTIGRYVKVWKQAISVLLSLKPVPRNAGVRNLLHILQYLYNVNSRTPESQRIPESDFCLSIDDDFLNEELLLWHLWSKRQSVHNQPLLLCNFPIVMDLQAKKNVLDMNASATMIEAQMHNVLDLFMEVGFCIPCEEEGFFVLELRRASLLEDTFEQLAQAHRRDYQRPLAVYFDENYVIDNLYKKDFFHEVFHEMMSAESGMFMFSDSKTLAWFPSRVTQEHQRYFLFGFLCGLALYNQCIIYLPFPMALFKKLLGVKPSLEDMMEFSPRVGKSLQYILDDDIDSLDMCFVIDWDGQEVDLDPENPEKPLTNQNKVEFVDAYVNHAFNTSVEDVFQEFRRGFFQLCARDLVRLFRPKELHDVLVGKDFHDWEKLKKNTLYEGVYHADHPTIQMFWEVFDELTEDQKKTFIWFLTGFERVPILGLENVKMKITVRQVEELPVDQCFHRSHFSDMFLWGEDRQRVSVLLTGGSNTVTQDGVDSVELGYHIRDLSAGHSLLTAVKSNGEAFIIRTQRGGGGGGGEQSEHHESVKCKEKIEAVSCGEDSVTLLSASGTVFCVDTTHSPFTPRTPAVLCKIPVRQVACGSQHSVALTRDGQVYTWGQGSRGQLGLGKTKTGKNSPQHLQCLSVTPLVKIAAGGEQSFAVSVSGGVFGWGRNNCGQLGLGDTRDRDTPTPVHYLNMKKTTHISCGSEHTAVLTKDGAVFTFGSGQYGQLGHNSLRDELRPRLVAELLGAKVAKIACGRHHTLVLTDSRKVYSFGRVEQGQLGRGENSHPSVPLPVQVPQDTSLGHSITNIYAGGNRSFATRMSKEDIKRRLNTDAVNNAPQHSLDGMIGRWTSKSGSKSQGKNKEKIRKMFSSASCLNQSFLDQSKDKHFWTSSKYSGLNLDLAEQNFERLVRKDSLWPEAEAALLQLLPTLDGNLVGVEGLRIFLLLTALLYVIQEHEKEPATKLAEGLAAALQRLSAESLQVTVGWLSSLPRHTVVKYVMVWKEALGALMSRKPFPRNSGVRNMLLVLQHIYNANSKIARHKKIEEKLYCLEMNPEILQQDVQLWRSLSQIQNMNEPPLILCNYPFVMDLKSKLMAFAFNAVITQPGSYFELHLTRASLMDGTFRQLGAANHYVLKKPLAVYFDGDPKLTLLYKRDFFHHFFSDLVLAKSGMFMFNDSKTLAWFPSKATVEDNTNFHLLGLLCGLALYNQCVIHLPFPLALFKKLLGIEPTLEDMMEFSPCVAKSLQYTMDYDGDVEKDLVMSFLVSWDGKDVDLDPQNPERPVTSQNREEFVDTYVSYAFNTSVESVFQEFARGFFLVCDRDFVKLFRPEELQGVLVGKDIYDWAKLKQNTVYEWPYHYGHNIIKMFWEIFDELTEEQKKDFLFFVTGCRKASIFGMDEVHMRVRGKQIQCGSHDQHFPESLTCHYILELPFYSTKDIMRDRLTEALIPERGFSM
ncbi:hypothetical protein INR49_012477 [Caranx melampygus]|nr:hypothetical protein INR49_012477 [Caranx melampygus]